MTALVLVASTDPRATLFAKKGTGPDDLTDAGACTGWDADAFGRQVAESVTPHAYVEVSNAMGDVLFRYIP